MTLTGFCALIPEEQDSKTVDSTFTATLLAYSAPPLSLGVGLEGEPPKVSSAVLFRNVQWLIFRLPRTCTKTAAPCPAKIDVFAIRGVAFDILGHMRTFRIRFLSILGT